MPVITSYSIHYTKLYDQPVAAQLVPAQGAGQAVEAGGEGDEGAEQGLDLQPAQLACDQHIDGQQGGQGQQYDQALAQA